MAAAERSLDIPEAQLLVWRQDDADGVPWHHCICLVRAGGAGRWVALDPDLRLVTLNLGDARFQVLGRNAEIPDLGDDECYLHDPISRVDLDGHIRRAKVHARLLSEDAEVAAVPDVWVIAGPGVERLGDVVPPDIVDDGERFRSLGNCGVAEVDGVIHFVQLIGRESRAGWIADRRRDEKDDRILGVHLVNGRRYLPLQHARTLFSPQEFEDWRFSGPRLVQEYLESIDEAGGFVAYETNWHRSSGVDPGSSAAHEHRTGNESLRLGVEVDQLDVTNLHCFENLCRRQVQLELAVERCPTQPDFTGLSEIMDAPTSEKGAASTRTFRKWMGEQQKDRAKVLQQGRLEREELQQLSKRNRDRDAGDGDGGKGRRSTKKGDKRALATDPPKGGGGDKQ